MALLIRGAQVFDGERTLDATEVLIEDGLIAGVGSGLSTSVPVVEAEGQTLLPGLIDAHVHLSGLPWAERHLCQSLAAGVTTVLSMSDDPNVVHTLKAKAATSAQLADLRSAGWCATVPGGHPTQWAEGHPTLEHPDQAPGYVRTRLDEGSDYLKIIIEDNFGQFRQVPPELTTALANEAHRYGLLAVAHIDRLFHAEQALDSNIDGLAHHFTREETPDRLAERLAESNMFVIMTLNCIFPAEGAELAGDPRIGPYMDPDFHAHLAQARIGDSEGRASDPGPRGVNGLQAVSRLHTAGVDILAGTDAAGIGAVGPSLHHELALLVRGGLTPAEALATATSIPARRFRLPDRGRIEPGRRADLLLVDGDPTTDILATRAIGRIWRSGIEFDRDAYRLATNRAN